MKIGKTDTMGMMNNMFKVISTISSQRDSTVELVMSGSRKSSVGYDGKQSSFLRRKAGDTDHLTDLTPTTSSETEIQKVKMIPKINWSRHDPCALRASSFKRVAELKKMIKAEESLISDSRSKIDSWRFQSSRGSVLL